MSARLIFVYNANEGLVAGLLDSIHKTVSPSTYACSLCAITYGAFAMDRQWKAWLKALPYETMFHHRPDFRAAFPQYEDATLPAVFIERNDGLSVLLGPEAIAAAKTVDALIAVLEFKLAQREA